MELHNADTPKVLYIVYMLIFSLMSPIGIAIGIAVTSAMENETTAYILTTGVLQVRLIEIHWCLEINESISNQTIFHIFELNLPF